jgi:hypothetical protein
VTCAFSEMNGMALRSIPGVSNPARPGRIAVTRFLSRATCVIERMRMCFPRRWPMWQRCRLAYCWAGERAQMGPPGYGLLLSTFSCIRRWAGFSREETGQESHHPRRGQLPVLAGATGIGRSAIGWTIRVNSQPATVVGVAPKEFLGASPLPSEPTFDAAFGG